MNEARFKINNPYCFSFIKPTKRYSKQNNGFEYSKVLSYENFFSI